MRMLALFASTCLALAGCSPSTPAGAAPPAYPVSATLETLPATVEGRLVFDLEGGAEGDGSEVHASFEFKGESLSVKLPVSLAKSLDLPEDGGLVRVTISSDEIEDGDSTLVITAAQKL
jgi:hypothetical protein